MLEHVLSKQTSNPKILENTGLLGRSVLVQHRLSLVSKQCVDFADLGHHVQSARTQSIRVLDTSSTRAAHMELATYSELDDADFCSFGAGSSSSTIISSRSLMKGPVSEACILPS